MCMLQRYSVCVCMFSSRALYNYNYDEYWWNEIAMWDLHMVQMDVKESLRNANVIFSNTIDEVEFQQYKEKLAQKKRKEKKRNSNE